MYITVHIIFSSTVYMILGNELDSSEHLNCLSKLSVGWLAGGIMIKMLDVGYILAFVWETEIFIIIIVDVCLKYFDIYIKV